MAHKKIKYTWNVHWNWMRGTSTGPLWGITTTKNNNATRRAQQQQGRTRPLGRLYEVATRRARSWCHRRTAPPEPSLGRHRALMHLKVHARPDKKSTLRCDSKKKNNNDVLAKVAISRLHARVATTADRRYQAQVSPDSIPRPKGMLGGRDHPAVDSRSTSLIK